MYYAIKNMWINVDFIPSVFALKMYLLTRQDKSYKI